MLSWITGPRNSNVVEDTHEDPAYDTTFIEPPDTPAHQFAMKAFRQAIFGTPAPEDSKPGARLKKAKLDAANAENGVLPAPKDTTPTASPSKKPIGILMTPRTANKEKKTVSFGAHVKDNEGKRISRSGIPNDCPGKFPSPWTPGTQLQADATSDSKPRTKLTEALYDARATSQPRTGEKPKARDDSDITLDLGAPRSESGKYWKEQYESYADRSETQMRQLVKKQQVAKNFAKKKDGEAMEAATRLAEERRRSRNREKEMERQNKDLQERLRKTVAENSSYGLEIAALKSRIQTLEKSLVVPSSEFEEKDSKLPFSIYEDVNQGSSPFVVDPPAITLGNPTSSRMIPEDKENSPPKARHQRRQTLDSAPSWRGTPRPGSSRTARSTHDRSSIDVSYLSTKASQPARPIISSTPDTPKPVLSPRKLEPSKENLPPATSAPAPVFSSPLPQGSPDPWLEAEAFSPPQAMGGMDLPIFGVDNSKPAKPRNTIRNRATRTALRTTKTEASKTEAAKPEVKPKVEVQKYFDATPANDEYASITREELLTQKETVSVHAVTAKKEEPNVTVREAKVEEHQFVPVHRDGSADLKERTPIPLDRKEMARRRLAERKARKTNTVLG